MQLSETSGESGNCPGKIEEKHKVLKTAVRYLFDDRTVKVSVNIPLFRIPHKVKPEKMQKQVYLAGTPRKEP